MLEDMWGVVRGKFIFFGDFWKFFLGVCDRFVFFFRMYLFEFWINWLLVWVWIWNFIGNVKKLWFLVFLFFSKFDFDIIKLFCFVDWILYLVKRGNLLYFFDLFWDWREVIFIGKWIFLFGFLFFCVFSFGCFNGVINCGFIIIRGFDLFLFLEILIVFVMFFCEICWLFMGILLKSFFEFFFCCFIVLVYINLMEGKVCICRELLIVMLVSFLDDDFFCEICLLWFFEGGGGSGVVGFMGCFEFFLLLFWKKEKYFYIMRRFRKEILYEIVLIFN